MAPGVPIPNADVLYRLLMTRIFEGGSNVDGSYIVDFLLGESKPRDPDIPRINVLDYPTFRKIIKLAKARHMNNSFKVMDKKYMEWKTRMKLKGNGQESRKMDKGNKNVVIKRANKTRRLSAAEDAYLMWYRTWYSWRWWRDYRTEWTNENDDHLRYPYAFKYSLKIMSLIQQCIYQTQYNLKKTKFYRKRFQIDLNYQFALMYGMILESKDKIDSLVNTMLSMNHERIPNVLAQKFIYFLSVYEKVLAAHTDITYLAHHLMELTRGIREGIRAAQKRAEPRDKMKRPEVRRSNYISKLSKFFK